MDRVGIPSSARLGKAVWVGLGLGEDALEFVSELLDEELAAGPG